MLSSRNPLAFMIWSSHLHFALGSNKNKHKIVFASDLRVIRNSDATQYDNVYTILMFLTCFVMDSRNFNLDISMIACMCVNKTFNIFISRNLNEIKKI